MLVKYQSNLESVNFEILYNLILNILIALTESNNYAYQFKNILKLDKFGFDLAEIKYLNDQFENYIEYPEDEESSSGIEVNRFSKYSKEENENDNKSLI